MASAQEVEGGPGVSEPNAQINDASSVINEEVSSAFNDVRRVSRHQLVYKALAELLSGPVHALALHTYTIEEWIKRGNSVPSSPHCMGGGVQN